METLARLTVNLGRLDDGRTETIREELDQAILELDDLEYVHPLGPLHCELKGELLGDEFLVRGKLSLPCRCTCGRCGKDFETVYSEKEYCESFPVAGVEELDLTESVREGIILVLPSYPICKEACLGVCLHCGQDLNAGPCACSQQAGNSPWDALEGFTPEA